MEELYQKEDSFYVKDKKKLDDKEAAEEIRKEAMERMASKKSQMNPQEEAPTRAEEAGVMRWNSWKKKLKVNIPFGNRI